MSAKKYFGKYRGTVLPNIDPLNRARIRATVPAVSSLLPTTWCEPCLPLACGSVPPLQMGAYFVPPTGANVWIEFEDGDPNRPIWTGCFWSSRAGVPALALTPTDQGHPGIVLQTAAKNFLGISDSLGIQLTTILPSPAMVSLGKGGITLQSGSAMITIAPGLITITNGTGATITLGPGNAVAVNKDGLIVT